MTEDFKVCRNSSLMVTFDKLNNGYMLSNNEYFKINKIVSKFALRFVIFIEFTTAMCVIYNLDLNFKNNPFHIVALKRIRNKI